MRTRILTFAALIGLLFAISPDAVAHHSFCGTYDSSKPFVFKGKVAKVDWRNPHTYLYLDVKDEKGVTQQWVLHAAPAHQLAAAGWKADTLKFGDEVIARGFLSKNPNDKLAALSELVFNGKTLWAGTATLC